MVYAEPIDLSKWIDDNKHSFAPPVCNKYLYGNGQLKIMVIGGPNLRKDFHIDNSEEFFFQMEGDMTLNTFEKGEPKVVPIKEGQVFRLQSRVPHSPQRNANTVGLVIERKRRPNEMDGLRYYCEDGRTKLYESWFSVNDLVKDLPIVIKEFFNSEQCKTGKPISGSIPEDPPLKDNLTDEIVMPKNIKEWIAANREEIQSKGFKELYGDGEFQINVYGEGKEEVETDLETFFMQFEGESTVTVEGARKALSSQYVFLVPENVKYAVERKPGAILMTITMDARKNR